MDVRREVVRLAIPAIAQSLVQTSIFVADRVLLGQYDARALAALQIASPMAWTIFAVFTAFSAGTVAVVGRSFGAGDLPGARAAARASIAVALGAGTLVAVAGWLGFGLAIRILFPRADPAVARLALEYLRIVAFSLPFLFATTLAAASLQGAGDTRTPMVVGVGANVLKVALGAALIFGIGPVPEMGMNGAAWATTVAFVAEGVALVGWLASGRSRLTLWGPSGSARAHFVRVVRVSLPAFAERSVYHTGMTGFFAIIALLGSTAMAANQALISIEAISFLSADGFGIAAAAIVALRLGAGRPDEAELGARTAIRLAVISLTVFGVVFAAGRGLLVAAFTDVPAIRELGAEALLIGALAQPFMAVTVVAADTLRGAGETAWVLLASIAGAVVVRVSATWLFAVTLDMGLVGVWLGSGADWVVRAAILTLVLRRGRWKLRQV